MARFTLTPEDKAYLRKIGYPEGDFNQIEEAVSVSTYKLERTITNPKKSLTSSEHISATRAIDLLGRQDFLSGISRSAFHWTSVREVEKECFEKDKTTQRTLIYFNSRRLFQ